MKSKLLFFLLVLLEATCNAQIIQREFLGITLGKEYTFDSLKSKINEKGGEFVLDEPHPSFKHHWLLIFKDVYWSGVEWDDVRLILKCQNDKKFGKVSMIVFTEYFDSEWSANITFERFNNKLKEKYNRPYYSSGSNSSWQSETKKMKCSIYKSKSLKKNNIYQVYLMYEYDDFGEEL